MKILFTTFYDPAYLGIRYLAGLMRQAGHQVRLLQLKSFRANLLPPDDIKNHTGYYIYYRQAFSASGDSEFPITDQEMDLFAEDINKWQPDIIGFTNRSPYNHLLYQILPVIKNTAPNAFLVGGGFGPTFNPEISLKLGADAVIRGEGEGAMADLAEALNAGRDWRHIPNLAWLDEQSLPVLNPLRPLITDLDSLPFALNFGDYFASIEDNAISYDDMRLRTSEGIFCRSYPILTSRGCIGHCSYCAGGNWRSMYNAQGLTAPKQRMRSLNNVFQELLLARDMGETTISFVDEFLVRPYAELCDFFERYAREINLPFYAHFHHRQLMSEEKGKKRLLEIVKRAGLTEIPIGVQSADEDFARKIYYRNNNNDEILQAINTFQQHGLSGNYHIIGANPLENDEAIEELYKFVENIPFDPSLKTEWRLLGMHLKLLDGSPLVKDHPKLKDMTYPPGKFGEIMLLADLRNKVNAGTFAKIRNNPFYKNNLGRMQFLFRQIIRDHHTAYLIKESERLRGCPVYFWGHGEMYHYRSHLFGQCKPVCIIDDTISKDNTSQSEDGLAVLHPAKGLKDNLPIVIFSGSAPEIVHKIQNSYPLFQDIVTCAML